MYYVKCMTGQIKHSSSSEIKVGKFLMYAPNLKI